MDNGSTEVFTYNALGQQAVRYVTSEAATFDQLYDPAGQELGEFNATSGDDWWDWGNVKMGGKLVAVNWFSGTYFMHQNFMGSTSMVSNYGGATAMDEVRYPWGQEWLHSGSRYDEHFAGMSWHDYSANLDPTLFRMYSSTYGRWMSPDPLGGDVSNPQSLNRYAYVMNNPINLTDVLGLGPDDPCANAGDGGSSCEMAISNIPPVTCYNGVCYNTNPADPCGYITSTGDASCGGGPPGLWNDGTSIFAGSGVSVIGGGFGGDGGGLGSSPLSGDFGPMGLPGGGSGMPCDFGTCGGSMPGSGFLDAGDAAATAPYVASYIFRIIAWSWPYVVAGLETAAPYAGAAAIIGSTVFMTGDAVPHAKPMPIAKPAPTTGSNFGDCVQQFLQDLKACTDAYPPGPQRQNCFAKARIKFKYCKGEIPGPTQ